MKAIGRTLMVLHFFTGIGAMAGGMSAILNPTEPLGMPVSALRNGPFQDFLIPGIVLFVVIGLGNMAGGLFCLSRSRFQGYVSGTLGALLVGWIVIQCLVMWNIHPLHATFFVLGAAQGLLAFALLWGENLFPANIAKTMLGRGA